MPIRVKCPACHAALSVREPLAGKRVKCPRCKGRSWCPARTPRPAGTGREHRHSRVRQARREPGSPGRNLRARRRGVEGRRAVPVRPRRPEGNRSRVAKAVEPTRRSQTPDADPGGVPGRRSSRSGTTPLYLVWIGVVAAMMVLLPLLYVALDRPGRRRRVAARGVRLSCSSRRFTTQAGVLALCRPARRRRRRGRVHAQAPVRPARETGEDPGPRPVGRAARLRLRGRRLSLGGCAEAGADRGRLPGQRLGAPGGRAAGDLPQRPGADDWPTAGRRSELPAVRGRAGARVRPLLAGSGDAALDLDPGDQLSGSPGWSTSATPGTRSCRPGRPRGNDAHDGHRTCCGLAAVWLCRRVLWVLMALGHAASGFLLRQMEFDADRYEARMVGGEVFTETCRRLRVLGLAAEGAYADLASSWAGAPAARRPDEADPGQRGPDPRAGLGGPPRGRGQGRTGLFDTHPADHQRIARACAEATEGIFTWTAAPPTSSATSTRWPAGPRSTTTAPCSVPRSRRTSSTRWPTRSRARPPTSKGTRRFSRFFLKAFGAVSAAAAGRRTTRRAPADLKAGDDGARFAARKWMVDRREDNLAALERWDAVHDRAVKAEAAVALLKAGNKIKATDFELDNKTLAAAEMALEAAESDFQDLFASLTPFSTAAAGASSMPWPCSSPTPS